MNCKIRLARRDDLARINEIYNHYVLNSTCTYQEAPDRPEDRLAWFEAHGSKHAITVVEMGERVVGWGSLSSFHTRSAFRFTVENSVYVDHDWQRKGIGSALLIDLIDRACVNGFYSIIAAIDSEQATSIELHRKHGFEEVGRLPEVGYKFDRWLSIVYMQRKLSPAKV